MDKFLIVFDINHTLVGRYKQNFFREKVIEVQNNNDQDFNLDEYIENELRTNNLYVYHDCYLFKRQYTEILVEYLRDHKINFVLWTTAKNEGLKMMAEFLESNGVTDYLEKFSADLCTNKIESVNEADLEDVRGKKINDNEYFDYEKTLKKSNGCAEALEEISKIHNRTSDFYKDLNRPAKVLGFDVTNCVLVDDCADKSYDNQNYIQIKPPSYFSDDYELIRIAHEIDKFVKCNDNCYIKRLIKEMGLDKILNSN